MSQLSRAMLGLYILMSERKLVFIFLVLTFFKTSKKLMSKYSSVLNTEISLHRSLTVIKGLEFFYLFFIKVKDILNFTPEDTKRHHQPDKTKSLTWHFLGRLVSVYIKHKLQPFLCYRGVPKDEGDLWRGGSCRE